VRDLNRGTLANIDRKLLSGLGHSETWQMVRVPAAEAMWSAWKRYCDSLGVSMGRGIAALIQHELSSVLSELDNAPVIVAEREAELARRQQNLDVRERSIEAREQWFRAMAQTQATRRAVRQPVEIPKVGRNEPCPCGSRTKYKRCHGL
jgi:hypothetical protein